MVIYAFLAIAVAWAIFFGQGQFGADIAANNQLMQRNIFLGKL